MYDVQDKRNLNSTEEMDLHKTEENDGKEQKVANIKNTSTNAIVSTSVNINNPLKRKNIEESNNFNKKICFEDYLSSLEIDDKGNEMMISTENRNLSLLVDNTLESYLLHKKPYKGINKTQNMHNPEEEASFFETKAVESSLPVCIPLQEISFENDTRKFELLTSNGITNFNENTIFNRNFCGRSIDGDMKLNRPECVDSEKEVRFFNTSEYKNLPSDFQMELQHPPSEFSSWHNEITSFKNINEIDNTLITDTDNYEKRRVFLSNLTPNEKISDDTEILSFRTSNAKIQDECLEKTLPVSETDDTKLMPTNIDTSNIINLYIDEEMSTDDTELQNFEATIMEQNSCHEKSLLHIPINDAILMLNNVDTTPSLNQETTEEANKDYAETLNFRVSDTEAKSNYDEAMFSDNTNCDTALKLNEKTEPPYLQLISLEQDGIVQKNTFVDSTTSPSGVASKTCSEICSERNEGAGMLYENTDPFLCTPDEKCASSLLASDSLENQPISKDCAVMNSLEDIHVDNDRNKLIKYENEQVENDNLRTKNEKCKIFLATTPQLEESRTLLKNFGDVRISNLLNSESSTAPSKISQETVHQSPSVCNFSDSSNVNTFDRRDICNEDSRFDRIDIQDTILTDITAARQTIFNTKNYSTCRSPDGSSELIPNDLKLQIFEQFHNLQSSIDATNEPIETENFEISKIIFDYLTNARNQEFTIQEIVKFVLERNPCPPLFTTLHSLRRHLNDYSKAGILKSKANGKYRVENSNVGMMSPVMYSREEEKGNNGKRVVQKRQSSLDTEF